MAHEVACQQEESLKLWLHRGPRYLVVQPSSSESLDLLKQVAKEAIPLALAHSSATETGQIMTLHWITFFVSAL